MPHTHGFSLQILLASGNAKHTADQIRFFGNPHDVGTWRADPVDD